MCGSETLTTVVSSTSMKVPNITAMATIQGFTSGVPERPSGMLLLDAGRTGNRPRRAFQPDAGIDQQVIEVAIGPILVEMAANITFSRAVGIEYDRLSVGIGAQAAVHASDAVVPGAVDEDVEHALAPLQDALRAAADNDALAEGGRLLNDTAGEL